MGGRFTSVGRSQTSSSGAGGGQWICGAVLARFDSRGCALLRESPSSTSRGAQGLRDGNTKRPFRTERKFRTTSVLPQFSPSRRAMLRSQSGPAAGVAFSALPSSPLTRFQPALFRVLLQRRLALPLPLTLRSCRCGRPLDAYSATTGQRALQSGVLGRRGFALESAAAPVCRETGARVATNLFVRDMRRPEVVADGLPLFGGVQLAIDTSVGSARRRRTHQGCG